MASVLANRQQRLHGPQVLDDGVEFRIWAPEHKGLHVALLEPDGCQRQRHRMRQDADGFFAVVVSDARDGDLYAYQVDDEAKLYPDPASHFQPQGVHGPSQVVDHRRFEWSDDAWRGARLAGQVIYELHIGTFTPDGTWAAAAHKLPYLRGLGITLVEVLPVAAFPGNFGWGYDGVFWYAPTQLYGRPDDFRGFVNEAHRVGLGVILDVVYNHFGPAGSDVGVFSSYYESRDHETDWGKALNYDGERSAPVRAFVAENAAYWVHEYHLDGLRLDATHAIIDTSEDHVVAQLTRAARAAAGERSILVFAEDENQQIRQVAAPERGGFGIDGLWNDDFHHTCRVAATGMREAYYGDYSGSPQELINTLRLGYLYQGQWNARQGRHRGTPSRHASAPHFVQFLQNHDQVANSPGGLRLQMLTTRGRYRALASLQLLGPATPLLFMGQEFAASNPFHYFADHEPELAKLVARGRGEFMTQFREVEPHHVAAQVPDPADPRTFEASKLDWLQCERNEQDIRLHRDLLRLRREDPVFARQDRTMLEGSVIGTEAFLLRWYEEGGGDRLAAFNLGRDLHFCGLAEPLVAPPRGRRWQVLWSSEEPEYGGLGAPAFDDRQGLLPAHTAIVYRAVPV